jgi:hypothetical protein
MQTFSILTQLTWCRLLLVFNFVFVCLLYYDLVSIDLWFLIYNLVATMLDGEPIISLPPKTVSLKTVDFTSEERNFYNTLEVESREQFKVSS